MLTIREIQVKTIAFFTEKGVPNPKLDTDLLIAEVLGLKRLDLYLDNDRPLTELQLNQLRSLVKRRANREPLQYILGYSEFCGIRLKVTPVTLIPRQETEELVEHLRNRIVTEPGTILDLGTGCGALAIALAKLYPRARVTATDQCPEAIVLAQENAAKFIPENSIQFKKGSWFNCVDKGSRFDLIVSNPPYLSDDEMQSAEPEVAEHEPRHALVGGEDGLSDIRQILAQAPNYLSPDGLLALETGIEQEAGLKELAENAGLESEGGADMSGRPRFFFCRV